MKVPGRMQEAGKNIVNLFFANLYLTDSLTQFESLTLLLSAFAFAKVKTRTPAGNFSFHIDTL